MKRLENSIVLQNITIGLNSLNKKDYKFKKTGVYYLNTVLAKNSPEFKSLYNYIKEVLAKKELTPKNIKADKMPIKDGDKVFATIEQNGDKIKGEWLKGNYQIRILTEREYKVFDEVGHEVDKLDVAFNGAKVNVHCSPYCYDNDFGKGIQILLHAINLIEEGVGGKDDSRKAFGFDSEDGQESNVEDLGNTSDEDPEDLPF